MMKRAAIRRFGARTIKVSNNSVRTLLVTEEKFKEFCPLLWGEKDIVVNRENVLCPRLPSQNEAMTGLCWDRFIDKGQAGICRSYPVSNFHPWVAVGHNDSCDKSIPQRALNEEPDVLGAIVR
jgi:hypothetical protein